MIITGTGTSYKNIYIITESGNEAGTNLNLRKPRFCHKSSAIKSSLFILGGYKVRLMDECEFIDLSNLSGKNNKNIAPLP